ncbi:MAG TPA: GNAT family protein [Vicinamibacterales bacterium]|nr:GNAT family protein [Vicinamibacterales bacterium]
MRLVLDCCTVRSWEFSDVDTVPTYANNFKIWMNLRDAFPHPYTKQSARDWIRGVKQRPPETSFAIAVDEEAVGGIGFVMHNDVERVSAEIGYWLGEPFWGRGIVTAALRAVTAYAIETHGLTRVFAVPFAWNAASCRVLEKAGYALEGRLRKSAIKDGKLTDQLQYAFIAPDPPPGESQG